MAELIFYGASDDLVEFDGAIYEEFNSANWKGILEAPDGSWMKLEAEFCRPEAEEDWIVLATERSPGNSWTVVEARRPDNDIDPALKIEVPEGITVREL